MPPYVTEAHKEVGEGLGLELSQALKVSPSVN